VREKSSGGKKKAKEGTRIARQSGEGCGSARFLFEEGLFVEQTENASEALAKREKPAAISRGGEGDGRETIRFPHPPRQKG